MQMFDGAVGGEVTALLGVLGPFASVPLLHHGAKLALQVMGSEAAGAAPVFKVAEADIFFLMSFLSR